MNRIHEFEQIDRVMGDGSARGVHTTLNEIVLKKTNILSIPFILYILSGIACAFHTYAGRPRGGRNASRTSG